MPNIIKPTSDILDFRFKTNILRQEILQVFVRTKNKKGEVIFIWRNIKKSETELVLTLCEIPI